MNKRTLLVLGVVGAAGLACVTATGVSVAGAGCGSDAPPTPPPAVMDDLTTLTDGVDVKPAGCDFTVHTPAGTTRPVADQSGRAGDAAGMPRSLHTSYSGDPSTSVSIVWLTDVNARATRVEWGASASYGSTASGYSFAYPTDLAGNEPPSVRVHEVHLCGLAAGTTYHYRAGGPGATSVDATFHTAPARDSVGKTLRLVVAGDSRGNAAVWHDILKNAAATGAELLLYSGDAVDLGSIQPAWDAWFAAGDGILPSLPMLFAMGNHENSARHAFAQMALPGNEQWYSVDYGDVHLVVLDDSPADGGSSIAGAQAKFLDDDLAASKKPWKVVMHHKAIYSSSLHGSQMALQAAWMPIYDKRGVDVVFNGHDHDYERSKPMRGGVPAADGKSGTVYVVNGGGGADLYGAGKNDFTAFSKATNGYTVVDVAGGTLTLTAYEVLGGVATQLDRTTITK